MKKISLIRLWDKFILLVLKFIKDQDITQQKLADLVGMQRTHVNALLNKSETRPLTAYYLMKFIRAGVIKVKDINDGKAKEKREVEFWKQAKESENMELLAKIARIREQGVDFEKFLEIHFPGI